MNNQAAAFPGKQFAAMLSILAILCFLVALSYQCESVDTSIKSECREGMVWYKHGYKDYWELSGSSEGKPPTVCSEGTK
jgi:hypothetical protein